MLRLEFIGIPGAGKSFIRDKLVQRLKINDRKKYLSMEEAFLVVSRARIDKIYRLALKCLPDSAAIKLSNSLMGRSLMQIESQNRFLAKNGKSLEIFLASIEFDNLSIDDRESVISSFMETGSLYECLTHGPLPEDTLVFFEEGLVQKSFMFISHLSDLNKDNKNVFRYLENIPLPDLIIYVHTDLETCYERMTTRQQGLTVRLRNMDRNGIRKFLMTSDNHLKEVAVWLESNSNVILLPVNNNADIDNVIENLQNSIEKAI